MTEKISDGKHDSKALASTTLFFAVILFVLSISNIVIDNNILSSAEALNKTTAHSAVADIQNTMTLSTIVHVIEVVLGLTVVVLLFACVKALKLERSRSSVEVPEAPANDPEPVVEMVQPSVEVGDSAGSEGVTGLAEQVVASFEAKVKD